MSGYINLAAIMPAILLSVLAASLAPRAAAAEGVDAHAHQQALASEEAAHPQDALPTVTRSLVNYPVPAIRGR